MITSGLLSSNRDDWETPLDLFNELNDVFKFTLDPCSSDSNHLCNKYYTINNDGLSKSWKNERVYMNPPYGRSINKWVKKAFLESLNNNVLVVGLLPARTDTKWFHQYIYNVAEIYFLKGRLKFSNSKYVAPFPSMIVIWNFGDIEI